MGFFTTKHRIVERQGVGSNGSSYFYPQYRFLGFWFYYYDAGEDKEYFLSKIAAIQFIDEKQTKKRKIIHKV